MKIRLIPSILISAALSGAALANTPPPEKLTIENEADVIINRLAAAIAAAQSTDEIAKLVLEARQRGLTNEQIAFAFGIANELSPKTALIAQAYATFLTAASEMDESGEAATEPLTAAFLSGSEAVTAQRPPSRSGSASEFFQGSPLGSTGFDGGGLGGGGASPK